MKTTTQYNLRLNDDLKKELLKCSGRMQVSASRFIHDSIKHYIKSLKTN